MARYTVNINEPLTFLCGQRMTFRTLRFRFRAAGGDITEGEVKDLRELRGFDFIVNCTGLGAKKLLGDRRLVPIRGQVYKVR